MDSAQYTALDHPPHTKESHKRRMLVVASTTLALLLAFSLFWHPYLPQSQSCPTTASSEQARTQTEAPSQIPIQVTTQRIFSQTRIYSDLSPAADKNWTRLIPPNGGFVVRKGEGGKSEMAGVSMFHQLHCLSMIRMAVQDMRAGRQPALSHDEIEEEEKHGDGRPLEEHWVHCLDYLVQAVLCSADDTVEPAHEKKNGGLVVDGYGVTHQCRDPNKIWAQAMGKMSRPGWLPPKEDERL
jgi:hypothetical protein